MQSIDSEVLTLSEESVYYLERNEMKNTNYKSFFEYFREEKQVLFETIEL